MVNPLAEGYQDAMMIVQMMDELAYHLGYENGIQDLIGEEPAVNVELMQLVQERLEYAAEVRLEAARLALEAAQRELEYAEAQVNIAYQ